MAKIKTLDCHTPDYDDALSGATSLRHSITSKCFSRWLYVKTYPTGSREPVGL